MQDGVFVAAANPPKPGRRIEFIGDSITAATNVVRPPGAPSCGDAGYQSDWSQTYEALLCHRFSADCSTIAVGGKCVMRECGGLQMPDYFRSTYYQDGGKQTYNFSSWAPDAMFIDLGTNDERVIHGNATMAAKFVSEFLAFMHNATRLYAKPDIEFFVSAGPMENNTMPYSQSIVTEAKAQGLKATFVNMSTACWVARQHGSDNSDWCDGCATHPGIQSHFEMFEAAWPVMAEVMGWS